MKPHKWAKEIKHWADGAEIETLNDDGTWTEVKDPAFYKDYEYRIKPQPKEPQYLYVWIEKSTDNLVHCFEPPSSIVEDSKHKYIGKIKLEVDDA